MRYELFALEVLTSFDPETYELLRRDDESGNGSPLTWTTREGAEAYITRALAAADADEALITVVELTGATDNENGPDTLTHAYYLGNRPLDEPVDPERLHELARTPDGADA